MKLYGAQKHDVARCTYGCCGGKLTRYLHLQGVPSARGAARKRARRLGKEELERIGDEIADADFLARKPWFDDHHLNASDCYEED
jgi:hypothetical protein